MLYALKERLSVLIREELVLWQGKEQNKTKRISGIDVGAHYVFRESRQRHALGTQGGTWVYRDGMNSFKSMFRFSI